MEKRRKAEKVASDEWRVASEERQRIGRVPKQEESGYTPAGFVRAANKGVRAYGKWKSAQATENARRVFCNSGCLKQRGTCELK